MRHADPRTRRPPGGARRLAAGLSLLLAGACASTDEGPSSTRDSLSPDAGDGASEFHPIDPEGANDDRSLGKYLSDLDSSIRAWMEKTWTAASRADHQKQDKLELYLQTEARKRQEELLVELETGPTQNRIVAATALGFTRDPAVLSPLLAALEDSHRHVVQNALIGLSLLQVPTTPLDRVGELMADEEDERMRASAAYCARCLVEVGADEAPVLEPARAGVVDADPIVRSQCALLLALSLDSESIDSLGLLLYDDVPLVASAAARGLTYLGREIPEVKGKAARALTAAYAEAEGSRQDMLMRNLVALAGRSLGTDLVEWQEWSHRLP